MTEEKQYMDLDDEIILSCAFRYALGRMTYVVGTVADRLIKEYENIHPETRKFYVSDIEEADAKNNLGMDFDKKEWMKVKALFAPENHCVVKAYLNDEDMKNDKVHSVSPAVKYENEYWSLNMKSTYHTCKEIKNEILVNE